MLTKLSDLPKVLLHDHLMGGLRASTLVELADAAGYHRLPTSDPARLESWFRSAGAGDLGKLLWVIDHCVAVTHSSDAIERVAFEAVEDLALDGVIYAEVRMAPGPNSTGDLSKIAVVDAVLAGMRQAADVHNIEARLVLTALREGSDSAEIARIAVGRRDQGIVGFDLAGRETDQPLSDHAEAIRTALESGIGVTIHAGEEARPGSILEALDVGAQRIGVAYTLRDDITVQPDGNVVLGSIAKRLLDEQTPIELCPTSDGVLHGIQPAHHHFELLYPAGLNVSLNTDNRLVSGSSMTGEFQLAVRFLELEVDDLRQITLRSVEAAFCDDVTKEVLRHRIDVGYATAAELG